MTDMALVPRALIPAGVIAVLGATFAIYLAVGVRVVDCSNEASSKCSTGGLVQLVIAGLGALPALATLALAAWGRGHPLRWFLLTALVYAAWGVYVSELFNP